MVVTTNIKLAKVEVAQSDQEGIAECIKIAFSFSVISTACMTYEEETFSKGEMNNHIDNKEDNHFFEYLNNESSEVISAVPDSEIVEHIEPHKDNTHCFSCSL